MSFTTHMERPRFPELATERLELCEITRDHAQWYLEHFSLPEVVVGQGFPPPKDIDAAREELESYIVGLFEKGQGYRWGIRLKGGRDIVGSAGFYNWDKDNEKAKMGYDLRPPHWGKGIMREAMERIIDFGFDEMRLNRIELTVLATNERSVGLATRLGFVEEGFMRQFSKFEGVFVDEFLFAMLRSDPRPWHAGKSRV